MSDQPDNTNAITIDTLKPLRQKQRRRLLRLRDVNLHPNLLPQIPKQNSCVYLGPGTTIDTLFPFQSFFDQDHTIAGWFMPQYPRGGHGPLFASEDGHYFVGQGDYRSGNALISAYSLGAGVAPKAGDAVLTVRAGGASRIYLAPAWQAGVWQHLAVLRSGNVLTLYLNGAQLQSVTVAVNSDAQGKVVSKTISPTSQLQVPGALNSTSLGNLILGRSEHPTLTAYAQAYGLLDDVAVFDHALTQPEITGLVTKKRLGGYEQGLLAGWPLDTPAAGTTLPAKLNGAVDKQGIGPNLKISADRNSVADKGFLDSPLVYGYNTQVVRFPFPNGQPWKVVQEYCNPTGTHNGDNAAFCYDFVRVDAASGDSPVFASEGGDVFMYLRNGQVDPVKKREPNTVVLYNGPDDCVITYMHFKGKSLTDAVVNGDPPPPNPDPPPYTWVTPWFQTSRFVYTGQELGLVGPQANHLHLAADEMVVSGLSIQLSQNTLPMAFKDIEVLSPGDADWHGVFGFYIPKKGDQVRSTV
jgi:Concanavalin A-like lectin/glucanases superfamily